MYCQSVPRVSAINLLHHVWVLVFYFAFQVKGYARTSQCWLNVHAGGRVGGDGEEEWVATSA